VEPAPPSPVEPVETPANNSGKPRTSPLARKIAKEHGIDLASITGTGPQGRIVRADVEAAIAAAGPGAPTSTATSAAASVAPAESVSASAAPAVTASSGTVPAEDERIPANRLRSVAAKRLTESQAVPHFFLTSVVDVEKLLAFRAEVNTALEAQGVKASINDVLVRAVAVALRQHPEANASWVDDANGQAVVRHAHVNVGIAVATDAGLLVPVIRDANRKSLSQIATETVALAGKARDGKLSIDEMTGGTFSISNLGMFGIDQFTAVINPPEAAILAVGAASPVPVLRDGVLVDVPKLRITLTVDHRVMDGAVAAGFLRDLVGILEQPLRMLL
jgi:pyruvate dehydrogenase E2 component (dihydrolipoamide acetyltransferase)